MILRRREFMRLLGVAAGSAGLAGCDPPWAVPDRLVELALRGPGLETERQTVCGLCEGGCGLSVRLVDGLPVGLKGNPRHPLNRGGLCPVGLAGLELLYSPQRPGSPLRRVEGGGSEPVEWEDTLEEIAGRLARLGEAGRGDRMALLSGAPGALFQDLAERLFSRLDSRNVWRVGEAGRLGFGLTQGGVEPPRFDLAGADLVASFGLDVFEDGPAPVHAMSALIGSRQPGTRCALVQVGTRLSPSACKAEIFVPVRPGTHGAFALGVAHVLIRENRYDAEFVRRRTLGFEDWSDGGRLRLGFRRLVVERYYPDRVAGICGCEASALLRVARRIAASTAPLALVGGEALEGSNATRTSMAVHALNALNGVFDRPGGVLPGSTVPLSPLPEPTEPSPPASSPRSGGLTQAGPAGRDPVEALAEGVLDGSRPIDILFLVDCNPVAESPAGGRLREAMGRIPMTVALAPFLDATSRACGLTLPTSLFLEDWRASTGPSWPAIHCLALSSPVIEPLHGARSPGDVFLQLGRRLDEPSGPAWFPWSSYPDYLKARIEGLLLSGQGTIISGSFEESWRRFLEERGWRFRESGGAEGLWKELVKQAGWWDSIPARGDGSDFSTPSGRFEFFSRTLQGMSGADFEAEDDVFLPRFEEPAVEGEGELFLAPFRPVSSRGRWGVHSPMVLEMFGHSELLGWETWAELSPETADGRGLAEGDRIEVASDRGRFEAVVRLKPGGAPGVVHVPLGLGRGSPPDVGRQVGADPVSILEPVHDSLSGALALQGTRVRIRLLQRRRRGGPAPSWLGEEA